MCVSGVVHIVQAGEIVFVFVCRDDVETSDRIFGRRPGEGKGREYRH